MGAPHQLLVGRVAAGARVGAGDAGLRQIVPHPPGALDAPAADAVQAGSQFGMLRIDAQTDDVHGLAAPAHRDFDARDQPQPCRRRHRLGSGNSRHVVVIGQRERVHAIRRGARDDFGGRQHTVGHIGMAMQIDIEHR